MELKVMPYLAGRAGQAEWPANREAISGPGLYIRYKLDFIVKYQAGFG
jgi:hypothetical protein